MFTEKVIQFEADGYQLTGTLHLPDADNPPVIIGCHGLLANRHSPKQIALAEACNRKAMAYFRFDHRGCGDSQGDFAEVTSLAARTRDLVHAVRVIQRTPGAGPLVGLFGSSFGGTVVLNYAAQYDSPALVTYAAPVNSASIHHGAIRNNNGEAPSLSLLTDKLEFDISAKLKSIRNIFVSHSRNDETVPVEHAHTIHRLAGDPKQLLVFPGGDHRMSDESHQRQFEIRFISFVG